MILTVTIYTVLLGRSLNVVTIMSFFCLSAYNHVSCLFIFCYYIATNVLLFCVEFLQQFSQWSFKKSKSITQCEGKSFVETLLSMYLSQLCSFWALCSTLSVNMHQPIVNLQPSFRLWNNSFVDSVMDKCLSSVMDW